MGWQEGCFTGSTPAPIAFMVILMSKLILKSNESMGDYHWETAFYASESKSEISITQTWFDDTKILLRSNVIVTKDEIESVLRRLNSA